MGLAITMQWTAVILAGQRPGVDPLAAHFGETYKALVPVNGVPMLSIVAQTLKKCPEVGRIIILAQSPEVLSGNAAHEIALDNDTEFRVSNASISSSLLALLDAGDAPLPWLVTTADHPLLDPAMVAEFLEKARGDISVGMVERSVMLKQFPNAQRTWLKFSDGAWSGANLFAFNGPNFGRALTLWAKAEQDRKQAWKLFLHFGPWLALRAITRTIGLRDALLAAGKRIGVSINLVAMSDPVAAIDVDKPSDHALALQIIATRKDL